MERLISTPVNFVILPIFAFVNAQVRLVGVDMSTLLTDPVTLGVYFGMLLGKPIGIFGMTFALVKLKVCELPHNVNWHMIAGVGILGGIGFTMSILISGLAFPTAQFEVLAAKRHPCRFGHRRRARYDLHERGLQTPRAQRQVKAYTSLKTPPVDTITSGVFSQWGRS